MSGGRRYGRPASMVGALALVVALGACANATAADSAGGGAPGVSATEIDVGSLANISGPLSSDFSPIVSGVQAYFDMVNARGGVDGRKLVLKYQLDDQGEPTQDADLARTLVTQDHVFAVVGVGTPFFVGAKYLAQTGTPAFGYQVSADWSDGPSLFGQNGSYLDTTTVSPIYAYLANQTDSTSVAVLAYGITESSAGCQLVVNSLEKFDVPIGYEDLAVNFGEDMSTDVLQMKAHHVDMVISCMDLTGNIALSRALEQNGDGSIKQFWEDGYDRTQLAAYPQLMNGVYLLVQHVPFEAAAAFPGAYPGMETYLATMQKYEPANEYNEEALDGWLNANLFVMGLKAAGKDPTQAKVVHDINEMTDYVGAGLIQPVNWTVAHYKSTPPSCVAIVQANNGVFQPVFTSGSSVFTCTDPTSDTPVSAPPGLPGG